MEVAAVAFGLPVLLLLGSLAGWGLRRHLAERHRSHEAVDAVRTVMSMMITFAALVLGLLTSSAKSDFDAQVRSLQTFSVDLIQLDQRLREYGTGADGPRRLLRRYVAAAVADSWPGEPLPLGDYPRVTDGGGGLRAESRTLGDVLLSVDEQIDTLAPATPLQQVLLPTVQTDMSNVLRGRWDLVAGRGSGVSWPFIGVLLLWLTLAFFTFGLSTPASRLNVVVLTLAAVSVSAAVYLIVDFGSPLTGLINLPSLPMRDALSHMDAPLRAVQPAP